MLDLQNTFESKASTPLHIFLPCLHFKIYFRQLNPPISRSHLPSSNHAGLIRKYRETWTLMADEDGSNSPHITSFVRDFTFQRSFGTVSVQVGHRKNNQSIKFVSSIKTNFLNHGNSRSCVIIDHKLNEEANIRILH